MVNSWTAKSIKIANAAGYLDSLLQVYSMDTNPPQPLAKGVIPILKEAYDKKETKKLIQLLLANSEVFPVKDSYVGFLKAKPTAIDENPKTMARIGQRLYDFGSFKDMLREAERPIETNRQMGNRFKAWLQSLGYQPVNGADMLVSKTGIKFLVGSDEALATFANTHLGCHFEKGIDLVIKANETYIVGEAKFLTTTGGEQGGGFKDAFGIASGTDGTPIRIAVIDGYVWLATKKGVYPKIVGADRNIMSSLVLQEFLKSL
ncbi:hypothetical protein J4441_04690 [Candidatus Micrarchaeota archaeon]|nr:hypothetical protein [Candidatus Micrarchaeota archaeon]